MKKIGIVTIEGNKNYGNKLQNYAMQQILKKYNYNGYTLWQEEVFLKELLKNIKRTLILYLFKNNKKYPIYKRESIFKKFTKKYLNIKKIKRKKIKSLDKIFDYYVIGSDQVWNPDVIDKYLGLTILNNHKKCIAYASSIAQTNVNEEFKSKIRKNLTIENIEYVSLREETGKELIQSITQRDDINCVIDPTLMLEIEEWNKLLCKPYFLKKDRFILCYFLGEFSEKRKKCIEIFAQKNNCEIINILDPKNPAYFCTPNEFLYLEKNAVAIFTDSFHSSVFGFIFNTNLFILRREDSINDMSSRLSDFVNKFKLENRYFTDLKMEDIKLNHDYSIGYSVLSKEKEKGRRFLEKALDDRKDNSKYGEVK